MRNAAPYPSAALALFFLTLASSRYLAAGAPSDLPSEPTPNGPQWIWAEGKATPAAFFEREFLLSAPPVSATLKVSCDNGCKVFINDKAAAHNEDWNKPTTADAPRPRCCGRCNGRRTAG